MPARSVLVTGGAGYIGSHCCKALAKAGFRPVVVDNLSSGYAKAVRWGPLERGDIRDLDFLSNVFKRNRPSAVIHFAAFAYVGESVENPGKYYSNNVAGALALFEMTRDNGAIPLVFSSTCATYGAPLRLPIVEDDPQSPINPYGRSKLMVEQILRDFGAAYGQRSMVLRYFNAAGADPENEIGECHDPETHLIPLAIAAAADGEPSLVVNGDDYDTSDGTCIRDYVHVTDLADAHVRAIDILLAGGSSDCMNLGTGVGISVRQIMSAIERVTGRPVPHRIGRRRAGDPPILVAEPSRARHRLQWAPRYSDIDSIVGTAWSWHKKNRHA